MAARPTVLLDLILVFVFSSWVFSLASQCSAAENKEIAINEVSWMGTEKTASDEWLELYNNANYGINLNGWSLMVQDSFQVNLKGMIPAKGFYLLERSDDQTLPNIPADMIFKGSLVNKGQKIGLYNKAGILVDEIDCSQGWFGGDNVSKQTMERISPEKDGSSASNWQTSIPLGGTPKFQNSLVVQKAKLGSAKLEKIETINSADLNASMDNSAKNFQMISLKTKVWAFILAIFNGIIIIVLKRSLKQKIN
ncbi:MAG: lamin tail domain-containing protein [Candidatus Paceibacterota bacterium]|jgi:hypothetical protein